MKIIIFHDIFFYYIGIFTLGFSILILPINNLNLVVSFANAQKQQNLNLDCIIKGKVENPPPFMVLRWMISGECDSTIDYFIHFYDLKAVVPFQDDFLLFLET